jgi:predicted DNA-binding transcriptional regulator AlpA
MLQAFLFEKYGRPRLNMKELADALGISSGTLYNKINKGTLGVRTYEDGTRWADIRDVAAYLDEQRQKAIPA